MYQFIWGITWRFPRRVWCFVVGHDVRYGYEFTYEPDWCGRCLAQDPTEETTLPALLNRVYCWAVDHGWPEWLDL